MNKILTVITFLTISMSFLSGCSDTVGTKITFENFASNKVFINFRASLIAVGAGKSVDITEIPKGKYSYATTYELPPGTISSSAEGDVSGDLELAAGTRVLIVYASTFIDGVYTISATKTTSDDLSGGGDIDPIGP
ncbi:MAG: hypothetical protein IH950_01525 [Bacteroidetes bacterium]|nr:hypothetical protein [Bacteroidota bacterium]MCH8032421.1 hypothetical protein [Bacteroidota bacterium]